MKALHYGSNCRMNRLGLMKLFVLALFIAIAGAGAFGQKKEKLAKNYRDWLEHDVVYIITKDEREQFLRLSSDEAKDKFIKDFWEIRNPTPGLETNSYKDEIYKRIAFADSRFGPGSGSDGWRTDRGRKIIKQYRYAPWRCMS